RDLVTSVFQMTFDRFAKGLIVVNNMYAPQQPSLLREQVADNTNIPFGCRERPARLFFRKPTIHAQGCPPIYKGDDNFVGIGVRRRRDFTTSRFCAEKSFYESPRRAPVQSASA